MILALSIFSCSKSPPVSVNPEPELPPSVPKFEYSYVPTADSWSKSYYASNFSASTGSFHFDREFTAWNYENYFEITITSKVNHNLHQATRATLSYTILTDKVQKNSSLTSYLNSKELKRSILLPVTSEIVEIPDSIYKNQDVAFSFKFILVRTYPPSKFTSTISAIGIQLKASN